MSFFRCEKPHISSKHHGQPRKIPEYLRTLDNETRLANITASAAQRFYPGDWRYPSTWNPNDLVTQPLGLGFTWLSCPISEICSACHQRAAHRDCLVVAVDGACSGNGKQDGFIVKAGAGVYFRDGSPYNLQMQLPNVADQQTTSQQAELQAAILALGQVKTAKMDHNFGGSQLRDLIDVFIKTDSNYVVQGMTEWIGKWTRNDFRTDKGTPVTNAPLFLLLSKVVNMLQQDLRVRVHFWHVSRDFNRDADWLAKQSLTASYLADPSDINMTG